MTLQQLQVADFMRAAGQSCPTKPARPTAAIQLLREALIQEELDELCAADNLVSIADALADLLYVVLGTAVACGIDLEPIFAEVHRSNMSKFVDGHRREDGKWLKGPSYSAARLEPLLIAQGATLPSSQETRQ